MSSAFESTRLIDQAPMGQNSPMYANMVPGGVGLQETPQGLVTVKGVVDGQLQARQFTDGQATGMGLTSVYPVPSVDVLSIKGNEVAFTIPVGEADLNSPHLEVGNQGMVPFGTALNGLGREIVEDFPGDEKLHTEYLTHLVKRIGVVKGGAKAVSNDSPFVTLQIFGIVTSYQGSEPMPAGSFVRIVARRPSELLSNPGLTKPKETPGKVTLDHEPFKPSGVADRLRTHVRAYLASSDKYEHAMNMSYRKTHALIAAMHHLFTFIKMSQIVFLDEIMRVTGATLVLPTPGTNQYSLYGAAGLGATREQTTLGLAKAMGLLDNHMISGISMSADKQHRWNKLTRQILMKTLVPSEYPQLSVGWNNGRNTAVLQMTTRIDSSNPVGELYYKQLQAPNLFYSHVAQFYLREWSNISGQVVKGAEAGCAFAQFMSP